MKNLKEIMKNNKKKVTVLALSFFSLLPSVSHAADGSTVGIDGISTTVTAIMTKLGNEVWTILQNIAPIALGIGGALLAFKLGKKMFKTLTSA